MGEKAFRILYDKKHFYLYVPIFVGFVLLCSVVCHMAVVDVILGIWFDECIGQCQCIGTVVGRAPTTVLDTWMNRWLNPKYRPTAALCANSPDPANCWNRPCCTEELALLLNWPWAPPINAWLFRGTLTEPLSRGPPATGLKWLCEVEGFPVMGL